MIDRDALAKDSRIIGYTIKHCPQIVCQMPNDVVDEAAYYGFAKAVMNWNGTGKFVTYAFITIRHALREQLRSELHSHGYTTRGTMPKRLYRKTRIVTGRIIKSTLDVAAFRRGILAESGIMFA